MSAVDEPPRAPEFPAGLDWLNCEAPLTLAGLRGRVVLLAFWTYGRVDCHHALAELQALEQRFSNGLVVLGVHSPKFNDERETAHLRAAILRHGIAHPVVNDAGFELWKSHAVRAWPTAVLLDARGGVLATLTGEIDAARLAPRIEQSLREHARRQELVSEPLVTRRESAREPDRILDHPAKVLVTSETTLFLSDTGHHRILQLEYDAAHRRGRIVRIFGGGGAGLVDAAGEQAKFRAPHGLARHGRTLYVADTGNHAVRAVDLELGAVRTLAGTGERARQAPELGRRPRDAALRSPWALWSEPPRLFIAMAGSHQIWSLEDEQVLVPLAGSGREELVDGFGPQAGFDQPSDLASDGRQLFVADPEASAVRAVDLVGKPMVRTLVGKGLFDWGDQDGDGEHARLQHPTGLAFDGLLYVADSYNHRIKRLDPTTREVRTLAGTGQRGHVDAAAPDARFAQPEGVAVRGNTVFVADTNNHALRVIDLKTLEVATVELC